MKITINGIPTNLENDVTIIPSPDYGFETVIIDIPSRTTAGRTYRVEFCDHGVGGANDIACHCKAARNKLRCWHLDHAALVWKARQEAARALQLRLWEVKKAVGMSKDAFTAEWRKTVGLFDQDRLRAALHLATKWHVPVRQAQRLAA